jgi:hypothetical protein
MRSILADVVWPALFLEARIATWWAISVGLVVEYLFLRRITDLGPARAAWADVAMNAASTLLGLILIPIAGIVWEFFPGTVIYQVFDVGTFNPGTWMATMVMAAALNAFIERFVLRRCFKQQVARRAFWLLFGANAVSVGLAFASIVILPPET